MPKTLKLAALVFAAACGCVAAAQDRPAGGANPATSSQAPRPLTAQERRGKALYRSGAPASGREVTAVVGEVDVPGSTVTCAGCHGLRGEGKTEGGVAAGSLTWSSLVKPDGHTHPNGRKHGAFDESSFARAVARGYSSRGSNAPAAS